jgi:hypothetical protein
MPGKRMTWKEPNFGKGSVLQRHDYATATILGRLDLENDTA